MNDHATTPEALVRQIMEEADEMVLCAKREDKHGIRRAKDRLFIAAKRLQARTLTEVA